MNPYYALLAPRSGLRLPRVTFAWLAAFPALVGTLMLRAAVPDHLAIIQYVDARTCTACHTNAAAEVMHTGHWTWEHADDATGKQLGKNRVINNYCVAVPSNEPRCTSCHVGVGYADKTFNFNDPTKVDCLVCHDTTGTYKKFPTLAGAPWTGPGTNIFNGVPYPPVNLVWVAQNVGKSSRATCGACHFFGGGGDAVKHGDLDSTLRNPTRDLDVHMAINGTNFTCATCHRPAAGTHDIPGTYYSKSHPDSQSCETCHTATPHHQGTQGARLNLHTSRVGCQTCHIPSFARGRTTMMTWDWSTAGIKTNGQNQIIKDANGDPVYDTQKGSFTWASNVIPNYVWFNGTVDYITVEDIIDPGQRVAMNRPHGSVSDPNSRIMPVKRFTGRQPYDPIRNVVAVPNLFPNNASDTNAYWKLFNWTNALVAGMAYVGQPYSGKVGWIETEWVWVENHMVAPATKAVGCAECHTAGGGRLDFAALGYAPERAALLASPALLTGADHTGRFGTTFAGGASCVRCHPNKTEEVMDSVHYLWRSTNANLAYPGGGSHGMLDRFCGLVGSSAMVNYYADLASYKDSGACGKCHVGDSLPVPNPQTGQFTQQQKDGIDCLICHASAGNYDMTGDGIYNENDADTAHRLLTTNSVTGRRVWFQDHSLRAAESVGGPVGAAQCYRCHEHGQAAADYKRGTPFDPEHDVHAAAGMNCTQCHLVDSHKMARGSRVTDMHAWERQDVEVTCVNCHSAKPHTNSAVAMLNQHTAFIACETCHIPWTSGAARRVWAPTFGMTNGPEANIPIYDPASGVYTPYSSYSAAYNQRPVYRWFNGQESMLAEPVHDVNAWDGRIATKNTPGAKIHAFRPIVNGMVMDRRGFGYVPNFNPNFTMLAAMDMMAGPLMQMGFLRPTGLTPPERAALAQYPNLLSFDVETYIRTGDIQQAVNIGLGRMGVMMSGQDPWSLPDSVLGGIGANFWSGEVLGLDMPNNPMDPTFNPLAPPTEPTGSFITLSHAVKRKGALSCNDCHSPNGVMDFAVLGYPSNQVAFLQSTKPWQGSDHAGRFGTNFAGAAACATCHPNQISDVMASAHYLWRTPNPKLAFPGGGSHGMIDRFCALVGSSAMVNYFADLGPHEGSSACGKCHIGDSLPFPDPATGQFTQRQRDGLDCLLCHASEGNYDINGDGVYDESDADATHRLLVTDSQTGRRAWFSDKSLRAAESVGGKVDTASCLRCHEHGQAAPDYKRGTPFNPEHDVHAAARMTCTDCHEFADHKFARGSRVSDMHAWERQDVEVDCVKCHGSKPHPEWPTNPAFVPYNEHAAFIACETCHIPRTSGAYRRIWYSTYGVTNGPEAQIPILDPDTGVYEPYSVYGQNYAARPTYRWFNGSESMLAEPMDDASRWDFRIATKATPGAKIYPFRPIVNGMVMDRRGFGYDPNFNPNFTMAAMLDAMSGPLKMMGFMRPEGLTDRERAVMSQFPNLLSFDKETYVRSGDVREAVNVGLGRMGMLMAGQDAWAMPPDQLATLGANFWSGDLLGLDLPNNPMDPTYVPNGDPTQPTGSFISLSHAIERNTALKCMDCHSAARNVMDYRGLSYPAPEAERLRTLLDRVQFIARYREAEGLRLRWSCIPGRTYQLLAAPDLEAGPWTPVTAPVRTIARWQEYVVPRAEMATQPRRFFRVVETQP